ncbi:hypothetical protein [Streptosporangium carneum]|uniref:Chitinase n=1 Tax=Streptosporangium carneum TaxID=47481 RepID=A0A9W6MHK2_9ACTN|nr:hypothetical protein [Streptosporangium carneum]GLK14113.1 hypothetical protein GCM10017600_75250 [Streptosporangium carneum]
MPVATERSAARRVREPGTPPRSLVALASFALAAGTGTALWLLPSGVDERPGPPGHSPASGVAAPPPTASPVPRPVTSPAPRRVSRPSGFVTFVDAGRDPLFELPRAAGRDRVRWFTLGHLTAGTDGCTPGWDGHGQRRGDPVADRLGRLRAAGGEAGLAFGGPSGRELAAACADTGRLTEAYRRAVRSFGAGHIDFEIRGPVDEATVLRRADAIATLQREAAAEGRPLTVSFTLPAGRTGLTRDDQTMLRATRRRGAEISAVNLLVPIRGASVGGSRLRPIASAVQAAHPQITRSLGTATGWRGIALSPVLAGAGDLSSADARRLVAFTTRNRMAWLSTRGASPSSGVTRVLAGAAR